MRGDVSAPPNTRPGSPPLDRGGPESAQLVSRPRFVELVDHEPMSAIESFLQHLGRLILFLGQENRPAMQLVIGFLLRPLQLHLDQDVSELTRR